MKTERKGEEMINDKELILEFNSIQKDQFTQKCKSKDSS